MISDKGIKIKFLALVLVFVFVSGDVKVRCKDREREALLRFRQGLIDENGILSSWRSDECCNWYGVVCSNTTDHVLALQLGAYGFVNALLQGNSVNYNLGVLGGKLTSSLLELSHLSYLDLSWNDFGGDPIPEFIGAMNQLQHLILISSNFSGLVPPQLGNLTNLLTLDLSGNHFLRSDDLTWLSALSSLSRLDLSQFDLFQTNWLQHILNLQSLQQLRLQSCKINDLKPPSGLSVNSSSMSLSILDLSNNNLTSSAFDWLSNISNSLVKVDMSHNTLAGQIPNAFERLAHLEFLDLSSNMLEGEIPKSLGNLSHLRVLVLFENDLKGNFGEFVGNLSDKGMLVQSLEILDLDTNHLTGLVPDLRAFSALIEVYLGRNKFTGSVPLSLGQLSKLEVLDISLNNLEGVVSESHLIKLENLKVLDLSFTSLNLQISPDWNPPFRLDCLMLARCNMGPFFPKWIQTQKRLSVLDLSTAGIIDEVPIWLWSLFPSSGNLFLPDNQISGTIPDLSSIPFLFIDLSSNKISGSIPLFHPSTEAIQLSQNMFSGSISSICNVLHLRFLDLSNNHLSGEILDCWEKSLPNLQFLDLGNNSFSGKIHHSLGSLSNLTFLRLRDNNLSGVLPSTLRFCRRLYFVDVGGNKLITGEIPPWVGELPRMQFLILRSNKFHGGIPPEICNLTNIRILDISINNLSGGIPDCFNNYTALANKDIEPRQIIGFVLGVKYNPQLPNLKLLKAYREYSSVHWKGQDSEYKKAIDIIKLMDLSSNRLNRKIPKSLASLKGLKSLNLSRNHLSGNIIPDIGQMEMLESLDLSRNQLSGEMPKSFENLNFLSFLDLSNNNLSGKIPSSTQLQSFDVSSYAGNSGLCGPPLALCPQDRPRPPTTVQGQGEKDDGLWSLSFIQGFCISMAFGFILGFWGVVASILLKKSWRLAYFNFLDVVGDWFYKWTRIFLSKWRQS